jgi:hypothetical protein
MSYSVSGTSNSYASLNNYNSGGRKKNSGMVGMPTVQATNVIGSYIVPDFGMIGYNALTHGTGPTGNGYFDITDAYGKGAANCNTQYMQRMSMQ